MAHSVREPGPSGQRRVLVVEDDQDVADAMRLVLEDEGYDVTQHASGTAGLVAAVAQRPDAILLDVMLPDTDGWTMRRELAAWPETAGIPVVFVSAATAQLSAEDRRLAHGVVQKPFRLDELTRAVRDAVDSPVGEG
jgi:DNA-binding response OmpR family regulator